MTFDGETLTQDKSNGCLNKKRKRALHLLVSFLCIIVLMASWIFNFGWLRLFFALPMLIHGVVFCFANMYYSKYNYEGEGIRIVNYFVYITFLLCYILLPDLADDAGTITAVMGLLKNRAIIDILWDISFCLFIANIVLIVWQIVYSAKDRRKMKKLQQDWNKDNGF